MFILKSLQTAICGAPVTREERHLRGVEKRIAARAAALNQEISRGGSLRQGRVKKWQPDVLDRKRNNLAQLQAAHQRVGFRQETLQANRAQARVIAAASLVGVAASTAVPAMRPATRVAQALLTSSSP